LDLNNLADPWDAVEETAGRAIEDRNIIQEEFEV
jgi:hypothetical protein